MSSGSRRLSNSAFVWIVDQVIDHWLAIISAAGGGVMTYLASLSNWLNAWGPVGWGAVGLVSAMGLCLGLSFAYFVFAIGRQKYVTAKYVDKNIEYDSVNVIAPVHENQRIILHQFFHPFFRPTENVRFQDCEIFGPAMVAIDGCTITNASLIDCEIVIVRRDSLLKGTMILKFCNFNRCTFYRVTFVMNHETYKQEHDIMRKLPVISDGRIGDV